MPPWQLGHVLEDLGRSLTRPRRYEEAEPLLLRGREARSAAGESDAWLQRIVEGVELVVPALWPLEVSNGLLMLRGAGN